MKENNFLRQETEQKTGSNGAPAPREGAPKAPPSVGGEGRAWGGELYSLVQPRGAPSPATPRPFLRPLQGPAKPRGRRDRRCGVSSTVVQDRGSRARTHTHNHCSVLHSAGSRAPGSAPVGVSCASQGEPHPASDEQGPPPSRSREAPGGGRGRGVAGRGSPAQKGLTASCFSKESPPRLLSVPRTEYVLRIAWCSPVPSRLPLR